MEMGQLLGSHRDVSALDPAAGLRTSHYRVLEAVGEGARVAEIGERVGVTAQAAGQFIAVLVASGHLKQARDPADGRSRLVSRTAKGTRAMNRVRQQIATLESTWAEQVGAERYRSFREVLAQLGGR